MKIARYCCILGIFFANPSFSQNAGKVSGSPGPIISSEAMHVHFDKDIYLPGETIWFKAYLYNLHEISYAGTNFYVAIYDESGKLLRQKQYPVLDGSCNGDFDIPDTIQSSRIQFRAFTKAMIISDSNNVYTRILAVYNKENYTGSIPVNKTKELRFFPEGGQVVAELENHVALKAVYPDGSPALINGQIIEVERNRRVDTFSTDRMGIGKIIMIPSPNKNYIAVWKDENGSTRQTQLPGVNRYGVSFHTEIINKELQYTIAKNRSSDSLSLLHLLVQMGNYQVYKADLVIPNEMELSSAKFSIDELPAGLMQLTLFDKNWNPLQERLVFINDLSVDQQPVINRTEVNAEPKSKNTIEISLPDSVFTNLSVSIADINFYSQPGAHSIKQDILFKQLKGVGPNPDPLLNPVNNNSLDLIVMAHDWKKYDWKKVTDKKSAPTDILDNYISISANYKEKKLALPKDDALNLIISSSRTRNQFYNLKPVNPASYAVKDLILFDSVKILYQMEKNKDMVNYITVSKDSTLNIPVSISALGNDRQFSVVRATTIPNSLDTFSSGINKKFNEVQTIKGVVVKSKPRGNPQLNRIEELDNHYTSGMFSGTTRGYQVNVLDDPLANRSSDISGYITYRVPGVKTVVDKMTNERYFVAEESVTVGKKQLIPIPVFLNETRMENIGDIDIRDVVYIKYIPGIVIGATFRSTVGAIYIYTKKGNEADALTNKNMRSVYIKGYDGQKEFINPDYNDKAILKSTDMRSTVYWNPNIILDKITNKVKVEYYNNDVSKKLLLTIEGVNEKGKLIHIEKIIE